ncbi:MAG: hypothetical protein HN790_03845 [Methylococcales bacterium]|jgi:hypothetical protein|nr:hypothetical protein [Methylococcales bacterium]
MHSIEKSQLNNTHQVFLAAQNMTPTPEKQLWAAVLRQAIQDLKKLHRQMLKTPYVVSDKKFKREARCLQYYFTTNDVYDGGLHFICFYLNLEAENVQLKIAAQYLNSIMERIKRVEMAH